MRPLFTATGIAEAFSASLLYAQGYAAGFKQGRDLGLKLGLALGLILAFAFIGALRLSAWVWGLL